ncbi:MAG: hypothetical protein JJV98_13535 [Desulfosarcina sp.]|nr:hypothetical protein [Desulfobacterales bacterium]
MRAEIYLFLVLVGVVPGARAWCDENVSAEAETIEEDTAMPSIELLEFLGTWQTDDGEWVDPGILDDTILPEQESSDE